MRPTTEFPARRSVAVQRESRPAHWLLNSDLLIENRSIFVSQDLPLGVIISRNEIHFFTFFCPVVIILCYHQQVARVQFIFPPKNLRAYTIIIDIRPLIGTAYDNGFIHSVTVVTSTQRIYQFIARNYLYISEPRYLYLWQTLAGIFSYKLAQPGSIP